MKKVISVFVLPLTLISFIGITKWWYIRVEDGPEVIAKGFPLIYSCPGFHTSLSTQFFVCEFILDLVCYFLAWLVVLFAFRKSAGRLTERRIVPIVLWLLTLLVYVWPLLTLLNPDNVFYLNRDFKVETRDYGIDLIHTMNNYHYDKKG